jgi:hypothetical protein
MPTPRLFGLPGPLRLLAQRDRTVGFDDEAEHLRLVHRWAVKFLHRHRDLPESAAWGVSPIETFFRTKLTHLRCAFGFADTDNSGWQTGEGWIGPTESRKERSAGRLIWIIKTADVPGAGAHNLIDDEHNPLSTGSHLRYSV